MVEIWHNPRCTKSRQTLKLLQERGVEPEVIRYLEQPPDADRIAAVLKMLGVEARQLMRRKEALYKSLGLKDDALDEPALIAAMADNPILIERPVVIAGGRAAIGRPPEAVLEILA